ncbi:glycosyltransferase [Protaetiibacter larvae]|uniref:4,4'-diaponeurosporenoate glycosyltransferase n=1 Tax=Protaetiibacter larvae TaxID=2592654 RepID=A0A5C1Y8Q4_9MICO|nr:glycosyltransferase family 2 protein [Protaetiibacter larvae]QEO10281.1 glycosyltransferase family 2 protein [Protaetiibacter larvae]
MTTISVVIPARNDAEMLGNCLEALARQTLRADEIVVVDNGSWDATAVVAQAAGARVVTEQTPGIPRAASAGYDAARGELIARLDADSVPPADWLRHAVRRFERDPSLSVLTGIGDFYGSTPLVHTLGRVIYLGGMLASMTPYLGHPPIFGSNFVMRRGVWEELAGEVHRTQREIHDDLDLSLHIKPWMRVEYDPEFRVGISARPFETASGLYRRVSWVVPTLRNHWPDDAPWARRAARRRWREEQQERRASA